MYIVKWLNSSIWSVDGTLTGTTTLGQSRPGSNGNKRVLHTPQSSWTGASTSDCLVSYQGHLLTGKWRVPPLYRDTVGVFYILSWLEWKKLENQQMAYNLLLHYYCGIMVIIIMDSTIKIQILDKAVCISLHANAPGKGMNPIHFSAHCYKWMIGLVLFHGISTIIGYLTPILLIHLY